MPGWQHISGSSCTQRLHISADVAFADGLECVQLTQLRQPESCVHLTCFHVEALAAIQEFEVILNAIDLVGETLGNILRIVADSSPVSEHECFVPQCLIVEHHTTTKTSGCDDVGRIEGDYREVRLWRVRDRVAGILKEPDVSGHSPAKFSPIGLAANEVRQHDALCPRRDGRQHCLYARHVAARLDIYEDWLQPQLFQGCNHSGEGAGRCHHFVARLHAQRG
mmetsp:Transcript_106328/g.184822  ORF Transcript_106328/g.184822 Transcript_106328/m.184822 type:complete len:223 (+) Transcript_106328:448-1116(+)